MRLLLHVPHPTRAARLEPLIAELASAGWEVLLGLEREKQPGVKGGDLVLEALTASYGVEYLRVPGDASTHGISPPRRPRFRRRRRLRRGSGGGLAGLAQSLELDAIVFCPLPAGPRADGLHEAAGSGLPVLLLAGEQDDPDRMVAPVGGPAVVCLWSAEQEASLAARRDLAGVKIVVTGSPEFERIPGWEPTESRDAFMQRKGIDPTRPFHALVAGAELISEGGLPHLFESLAKLRRADAVKQVLVRAYDVEKLKALQSAPRPPAGLEDLIVWSGHGSAHSPAQVRADYLNSLAHSWGVLAEERVPLLDAALLGKPGRLLGEGERPAGVAPDRETVSALVGLDQDEPPSARVVRALGDLAGVPKARIAPARRPAPRKAPEPQPLRSFRERMASELDLVRYRVAQQIQGSEPVLAGPFAAEVGFELLYWIPFLRWASAEFPELRERLVIVSRGGTRHWSADLASDYVDIYDLTTPIELQERRHSQKQRESSAFDEELLTRARRVLGLESAATLHPSVFFEFYYRVMKAEQRGFVRSLRRDGDAVHGLAARYAPLASLPHDLRGATLPDEFVAVRFYERPSLPDTPENRAFIAETVGRIAATAPVVLLNNGLELDDHTDFDPGLGVTTIAHLMEPANNLDVQTLVLARARAFVGTYGGLAYLAPLLGVPSLAFSSHPEHTHAFHLELAQRVFDAPEFASIVALSPGDVDLLRLVTGS